MLPNRVSRDVTTGCHGVTDRLLWDVPKALQWRLSMGWGLLQLISLAECLWRPSQPGEKARIRMSIGFWCTSLAFYRKNSSSHGSREWVSRSFLHNGPPVQNPYAHDVLLSYSPPMKSCVWVSSCEPLQHPRKIKRHYSSIFHCTTRVRGSQTFHMQDIWVDQCLKRFVQAKRVFNAKLLSEAHCDPSPGASVISEFQIRISTWMYQSIMGQLGAVLCNSSCLTSVSCGRMARLQGSNSRGISSFQDRRLAMEMGRTGREWIVKFLDWPLLNISHTKPSLPKQEPPNASRLKAFFHLKTHDGVMALVLILWSVLMLSSKRLTHVRWLVNIPHPNFWNKSSSFGSQGRRSWNLPAIFGECCRVCKPEIDLVPRGLLNQEFSQKNARVLNPLQSWKMLGLFPGLLIKCVSFSPSGLSDTFFIHPCCRNKKWLTDTSTIYLLKPRNLPVLFLYHRLWTTM